MKSTKARPIIDNCRSKTTSHKRKKRTDFLKLICWTIIPALTATLLVFDALKIYTLTDKRLLVLGVVLAVILLPFFSEITLKDLSVKRSGKDSNNKK